MRRPPPRGACNACASGGSARLCGWCECRARVHPPAADGVLAPYLNIARHHVQGQMSLDASNDNASPAPVCDGDVRDRGGKLATVARVLRPGALKGTDEIQEGLQRFDGEVAHVGE